MAREDRKEDRVETGRSERIPLGVSRPKLSAPSRAGYVRRVINDKDGRLQMAQQAGYQFVEDATLSLGATDIGNVNRDLGSRVNRVVDQTTGQKAYLMEIKEEFYKEDQATKAKKLDETDRMIRKGKLDDDDSRYVPDKGKGIHIETR